MKQSFITIVPEYVAESFPLIQGSGVHFKLHDVNEKGELVYSFLHEDSETDKVDALRKEIEDNIATIRVKDIYAPIFQKKISDPFAKLKSKLRKVTDNDGLETKK